MCPKNRALRLVMNECLYALVTEDLEKHPYLRVGSRKRSIRLSLLEMLEQWIVEV